MTCINSVYYVETLNSPFINNYGLLTVSLATFPYLLFLSIFIVTHFFIFYLDKQSPVWLEKLPMSVYSRGRPFSYPVWFNSSADGWRVDAWPYFPGLKVRKNILFLLFDYLVALILNRDIVRSMVIPELGGWRFLLPFFLLSQGSLNNSNSKICRTTTDQAG
jgi:hypothetical protein